MELPDTARLEPGISHTPHLLPPAIARMRVRICRRSRDTVLRQGLTEAGRKVHKLCVETKSKPSDFADLSPVTRAGTPRRVLRAAPLLDAVCGPGLAEFLHASALCVQAHDVTMDGAAGVRWSRDCCCRCRWQWTQRTPRLWYGAPP